MTTKQQVLKAFDDDRTASSYQIAKLLGCEPEYVRATLRRNGKKLARPHGSRYIYKKPPPTIVEADQS